jgi:hypothetical protein
LTSALDGDEWSASHPDHFTPRERALIHWYPLYRRLGVPHCQSRHGGEEKNSQSLLGLEPRNIQLIAQCYTAELSRLKQLISEVGALLILTVE